MRTIRNKVHTSASDDVPLVPREVLFSPPERHGCQLSPDGGRLLFVAPLDGAPNLWVVDLADGSPSAPSAPSPPRPLTRRTGRGVLSGVWAFDGRHVLLAEDDAGDEVFHVHALDVTDPAAGTRDLTPWPGVRSQLLALSPEVPTTVLVGVLDRDPGRPDAYRVDLLTGQRQLAALDEGFGTTTGAWVADEHLRVLGAQRTTADGGGELLVRDHETAPWRVLHAWSPDDDWSTAAVAVDSARGTVTVITSAGGDTSRLVELDLADGREHVLHHDPHHDIGAVVTEPGRARVRCVVVERDRCVTTALDADAADVLAALQEHAEAVGAGEVLPSGTDVAGRTWLAELPRDDGPARWVLARRSGSAGAGVEVSALFVDRPALDGRRLHPLRAVRVRARDGLELAGYACAAEWPPRGLPCVLSVHGGPWSRESWGFHPEAQWCADRGYLWLGVDYRGSRGYGKAFLGAGDRQWGAAMQDDLSDALDHAVAQGWADPERLAVMGASYGGYAALMAAVREPGRLACVVDVCGPSDLRTLLAGLPAWWEASGAMWRRRIGDPRTDEQALAERSPLTHAHRITCPVLVVQGENDPRVPLRESEQLVAALAAHGVPHELVVLPEEGHGFFAPATELMVRARIEAFLAAHLGGRLEPYRAPSSEVPSSEVPSGGGPAATVPAR